jgi:hypothetical protein
MSPGHWMSILVCRTCLDMDHHLTYLLMNL